MAKTFTRIALGAILLLLFLWLPYVSLAEVIYSPDEVISINCDSSTNMTIDGRNWIADVKFLSEVESHHSVAASAKIQSRTRGPYTNARLSHSQFTYSFPVTTGTPKFLRLFFYSTLYNQNFDRTNAYFSVKVGPYTLLQDFNASLYADAADDISQPDILFREYCINLHEGERLNITFIPSSRDSSYAFINGIEIVSMPPYLYYTNPHDLDTADFPQPVGFMNPFPIENKLALETKYRLRVGDREIPASEDTGVLRTWDTDNRYLTSQGYLSADFDIKTKLSFTNKTPNYTAPEQVYRSYRNMGPDGSLNMRFNLTWQLPVDSGFTYLLRLHFCELNPYVYNAGDLTFYIYIQDLMVEMWADVLTWSGKQKGVPVVRDYAVFIPANQIMPNISLKMHPNPASLIEDTELNGIELFKISHSTGSLAGPNPKPPPQARTFDGSHKKSNSNTKTLAAVAGAVSASGVILLSFIVAFFLIKRKKNVPVDNDSKQKDGTSRGIGSSSLPTNLCRHFSITEIKATTNNFDELFIVGVGGFGHVYKGYIDDGPTCVAIKRLKQGSQQGVNEFVNEIEMLSQLRHLNLVSLIGYCYESNEMILVYDFMDQGTLRDHLYHTENPPLSWKQRLQICIGVARGLHYLHAGAKHVIIHRDIKSTNILLDEKWVAKVSDFGLSRIGPTGISTSHVNTGVKGSIGYLDPEYYKRQRLTDKSDVYSFGVVLLEVLSGRQPLLHWEEKQRVSLVKWAKHCYENGTLRDIVDAQLKDQIAPQCLLEDGTQRPSMSDVVAMLEIVLQFQESVGDYEDAFGSSQSSVDVSCYSKSTGFSTTSDGDRSCGSKESSVLISEDAFSEINDPKGR